MTTGSSAVVLSASGCPCVAGGTSYAYQSATLTAYISLSGRPTASTRAWASDVCSTGLQSGSVSVDNTAPTLTTVVGAATGTSPAGFVKQGGGYRVYANASDAGSGLNAGSLSVDVSAITTGSSAVGLSASGCPCVVGGTSRSE